MITVEAWTSIRYLQAQGMSIRAIAKELLLSRNTVRAALRGESPPHYSRPARPNPKLDPFLDQIEQMYFAQGFIGSRILRELRSLGYQGGRTALYAHLTRLKEGRHSERVSRRFETEPGQQAQFDWSPYEVVLGGQAVRVVVFCLTLCYSRRKFYLPSLDEKQASVFEALEGGLHYFGGAPKELVIDNARAFVDSANPERFVWNGRFLALCGHYRIRPVPCPPYWPRAKGKVERPFFFLEQHLIKGGQWDDFDHFAHSLAHFASDELDHLVHGTTRERPLERFEQEKERLTPLPQSPFHSTERESRKVSWDCLVSFGGSRYSVPWAHAGQRVWVAVSQGRRLIIYSQDGTELARHSLSPERGATVIDADHYRGLRPKLPRTWVFLEEAFLKLFPDCGWFLEGLSAQHNTNRATPLRVVLELAQVYPQERLRQSFGLARQFNTYSPSFLRQVLESPASPKEPMAASVGTTSGVGVDLGAYQRLLEASR